VYELGYEPGHAGPERVIAKTYSSEKGRIAFDGMVALWRSPLRTSEHVTIAEPLAFVEELNVLLQGPVPGTETLKDLVKPALAAGDLDVVGQAFGRTARGLAALHGCGAAATPATWQQELADVRNRLTRLARWVPDVDRPASTWLDKLDERARLCPADTPVPSHRSFRPAQVLLDGGEVGFIDFDGFCEAEPAMDLALFVATVKNLGMRAGAPTDQVERLCDGFVDEYRGFGEVTPERVALWEALYHLTNALNCWAKVRPERVAGNLALLDRHIERTGLPSI
jgi:Ser/Thr protein kinase RdoA (MazF antagonist)